MQNNNLLKNWQKAENKNIIFFGIILFVALIGLSMVLIQESAISIKWDILSELKSVPLNIEFVQSKDLNFNIHTNVYLVQEYFLAAPLNVPNWLYVLCGALVILAGVLILPAMTQLSRYWFMGGIFMLAFVLASSHLEIVFKSLQQFYFLSFFGVLAIVSLYFHSFNKYVPYWKKALVFSIIIGILISYIVFNSKINAPLVGIFSYAYLGLLVITAIFIVLVSHEIPAILVFIVSKNSSKNQSLLLPFIILSIFYLINILLIYLDKAKYISLDLYAINPVFLWMISLVLGIWGVKNFCEQTNFITYENTIFWLYIGFSLLSISTIGFAYASANDSLMDAIEDFIAYALLASGITFFVYVLVNFSQVLKSGLHVYKVIYRPKFIEFLLFRLAALVLIVVLMTIKNYNNFFQAKAGYFNVLADFYTKNNELEAAETFYKESLHQDARNHHANYALASISMQLGDKDNTIFFLKSVVENKPSPWAYIGLSKVYQEKDMFFESFFTLKEGVQKFPENQALLNNLAWGYDKLNVNDSTLLFLEQAQKKCYNCSLAASNLLAFKLKTSSKEKLKKVVSETKQYSSISCVANMSAAQKILNQWDKDRIEIPKDSILNVSQFANLYNQATNPKYGGAIKSIEIQKILKKNNNNQFYDDLVYASGTRKFLDDNKIDGIKQLVTLATTANQNNNLYYQNVAIWLLQQNVYEEALKYLKMSGDSGAVETLKGLNFKLILEQNQLRDFAQIKNKLNDPKEIEIITQKYPLNPYILKEVLAYYNKKGESEKAYRLIFQASEINTASAEIWKIYTLQSIQIGMSEYAEDGLNKLKQILTNADYQAFLSTYQAQKALMEKSKNTF